MAEGYIQLRRGIREHVANGWLRHDDALALILLFMAADPATGVAMASASWLSGNYCWKPRTARDICEELGSQHHKGCKPETNGCTGCGYVKRFASHRHENYPILIHKYQPTKHHEFCTGIKCHQECHVEKSVNAWSSKSYESVVYEFCGPGVQPSVRPGVQPGVQPGAVNREYIPETLDLNKPLAAGVSSKSSDKAKPRNPRNTDTSQTDLFVAEAESEWLLVMENFWADRSRKSMPHKLSVPAIRALNAMNGYRAIDKLLIAGKDDELRFLQGSFRKSYIAALFVQSPQAVSA